VAEHGGDPMLPKIGIMGTLYPGETMPTAQEAGKKISGGRLGAAAPID